MTDTTRALDLDAARRRTEAVSRWIVQAWADCPGSWEAQSAIKAHLATDIPNLFGEIDRLGRIVAAMAKDASEQAAEMGDLLAEVDRLTGHSVQLNTIGWRIAKALGDVPDGADHIDGDPVGQADRLIAEVMRLRAELDTAEERGREQVAQVLAEYLAGYDESLLSWGFGPGEKAVGHGEGLGEAARLAWRVVRGEVLPKPAQSEGSVCDVRSVHPGG